jgi:hypothetical protein
MGASHDLEASRIFPGRDHGGRYDRGGDRENPSGARSLAAHDTLHAEILVCRFRLAIERSRMATQRQRMSKTPKLNSLASAFDGFSARVELAADTVLKRMAAVGDGAEASVAKFGAAIDPIEALVHEIDSAANQMTNGGEIPLAASAKPPVVPVTLPPVTTDSAPATNPAPALPVAAMLHGVPVPDAASAHADAMRQAHAGPAEAKGPA